MTEPQKYNYIEFEGSEDQGIILDLGQVEDTFSLELWIKPEQPTNPEDWTTIASLLIPVSEEEQLQISDHVQIDIIITWHDNKPVVILNPVGEWNNLINVDVGTGKPNYYEREYLKLYEAVGDFYNEWSPLCLIHRSGWQAEGEQKGIGGSIRLMSVANTRGHYNCNYGIARKIEQPPGTGNDEEKNKPFPANPLLILAPPFSSGERYAGKIGRVRLWDDSKSAIKWQNFDLPQHQSLKAFWTFDNEHHPYKNKIYHKYFTEVSREKEAAEAEAAGQREKLQDFIETVRSSIDYVRQQTVGTGYHLGPVQLDFKFVPERNGKYLYFPAPNEMKRMEGKLSTLSIEFDPPRATQKVVSPAIRVPDMTGMTEIMARRALSKSDFREEVKYETTANEQDWGRVTTQVPIGGQPVAAGALVQIFIGKRMDE